MSENISRRDLLGRALVAAAAVAGAPALKAQDAGGYPGYTHLDGKDPSAAALGYVDNATKVDTTKFKTYQAGQMCGNCLQLQGKAGDPWRPCLLYPKKLVNVNGWCSGYVKKT
jgi:hypothetical protein